MNAPVHLRVALPLAAIFLALAQPARADVGIPMLALAWPLAWLLFPIVVLIEAAVGVRLLGLPHKQAFAISLKANAWSTLAGIPAAWGTVFLAQIVLGLVIGLVAMAIGSGHHSEPRAPEQWPGPRNIPMEVVGTVLMCAWIFPRGLPTWEIPLALLVLCVPFYFVSVRYETRIALRELGEDRKDDVRRWMRTAHLCSYGLIVVGLLVALIFSARAPLRP